MLNGIEWLIALRDFVIERNKIFHLRGLKICKTQYENLSYNDLGYYDKMNFGSVKVILNIIKGNNSPALRFEIFNLIRDDQKIDNTFTLRFIAFKGVSTDLIDKLNAIISAKFNTKKNEKYIDSINLYLSAKTLKYWKYENLNYYFCDALDLINKYDYLQIDSLEGLFEQDLIKAIKILSNVFSEPLKLNMSMLQIVLGLMSVMPKKELELTAKQYQSLYKLFTDKTFLKGLSFKSGHLKPIFESFGRMRSILNGE